MYMYIYITYTTRMYMYVDTSAYKQITQIFSYKVLPKGCCVFGAVS